MRAENIHPARIGIGGANGKLCLSVLFTGIPGTLKALREAAALAAGLDARIELVVPMVVPYPLALDRTPVNRAHGERVLRTIAGETNIPTTINVIHCRDAEEAIRRSVSPDSILIVARRKPWLFNGNARLITNLRSDGFQVITAGEQKDNDTGGILRRSFSALRRAVALAAELRP